MSSTTASLDRVRERLREQTDVDGKKTREVDRAFVESFAQHPSKYELDTIIADGHGEGRDRDEGSD